MSLHIFFKVQNVYAKFDLILNVNWYLYKLVH